MSRPPPLVLVFDRDSGTRAWYRGAFVSAAYRVAEQIPETLAQLPCYCYCDRGMGHKSLHSCFEDEHAAHCAVCVDEALLAYSLTKDAKMTPQQVREKIVEKYSVDQ